MFRRAVHAALLVVVPTFAMAQEDAQAAFNQFFDAFTAADAEAIVNLFATDATFYGTSAQDPVDQEGVRAYFGDAFEGREAGSIPGTAVGEPIVTMVTEDVATVTGKWQSEGMRDGQMTTRTYRVTAVLADRGDGWKIVQFHNSMLPE